MGSGGGNESNSQKFARIGEKKIFHQLDVHHVKKVGIKGFLAQEAEMSLTTISSYESARKNFSSTRRLSCQKGRNQTFFG